LFHLIIFHFPLNSTSATFIIHLWFWSSLYSFRLCHSLYFHLVVHYPSDSVSLITLILLINAKPHLQLTWLCSTCLLCYILISLWFSQLPANHIHYSISYWFSSQWPLLLFLIFSRLHFSINSRICILVQQSEIKFVILLTPSGLHLSILFLFHYTWSPSFLIPICLQQPSDSEPQFMVTSFWNKDITYD
jgi:hypothetical protein